MQELRPDVERYIYTIYKKYQKRGIDSLEELVRKVNSRGTYSDFDEFGVSIDQLSDNEIAALRYIWEDKKGQIIAKDRVLSNSVNKLFLLDSRRIENTGIELPKKKSSEVKKNGKYVVTREQPYNKPNYRMKKRPVIGTRKLVLIGSLLVCFVIGTGLVKNGNDVNVGPVFEPGPEVVIVETTDIDNDYANYKDIEGIEIVDEEQERVNTIQRLCNIYQVNYNEIYDRLCEITNDFTIAGYDDGILQGVTCKGADVIASSEEELLTYAIRKMKQAPAEMGLSTNNLYVDNGYESGTNYYEQISHSASMLGVDRCLIYAIVQSECGFDSEIFNEYNNPAGIKLNGDWWKFDTKEEGFLELCMEVLKYYRMIGVSPDVVNRDVIVEISKIHAPRGDKTDIYNLNDNWIDNVTSCYEYAKMNEAELFGTMEQSNGLSY